MTSMRCVVLDAMGVVFSTADDVVELLIPFIRESGGADDDGLIQSTYVEASLGAITADEFWLAVGLRPTIEDDYLSRHSPMPGAIEFLRSANEQVISSDARARKPSAAIYRCLLDRCGYRPADILFVDDRQKNVEAADELGMSALRFEPDAGFSMLTGRLSPRSKGRL